VSVVVLQQNKGSKLFSSFILLNVFVMKSPFFTDRCSDLENQTWLRLQGLVLTVLQADPVFLEAFLTLQEQLTVIALDKLR
jgi:hypothetical protein